MLSWFLTLMKKFSWCSMLHESKQQVEIIRNSNFICDPKIRLPILLGSFFVVTKFSIEFPLKSFETLNSKFYWNVPTILYFIAIWSLTSFTFILSSRSAFFADCNGYLNFEMFSNFFSVLGFFVYFFRFPAAVRFRNSK